MNQTKAITQHRNATHVTALLVTGECITAKICKPESVYPIGGIITIRYETEQLSHPARCYFCKGAGCKMCEYTGTMYTYTDKRINLTSYK